MKASERFQNYSSLVKSGNIEHRRLMLLCLNTAIESVLPKNLMRTKISVKNDVLALTKQKTRYDLRMFDKVIVVGAGKASGGMAVEIEKILPRDVDFSGAVAILEGTSIEFQTRNIELLESSHPIPGEKSVRSSEEILRRVNEATENSLVICLISGGGSALMSLPANGINLEDKIATTNLLLKSGAGIEQINCVRKHLSSIKGGQLAKSANGAQILSLIISDIVGNPLGSIASGPTAPDPTTFRDALSVLEAYQIQDKVPGRVLKRLGEGIDGKIPETPKPEDPVFQNVTNFILGDNSAACAAIIESIKEDGNFKPYYLGSGVEGESREAASNLASTFLSIKKNKPRRTGFSKPSAFIWGGETTVTVTGTGKGGRNQEEALSALRVIATSEGVTIAFLGTDGKDGFSDAAGAITDSKVGRIAGEMGLDVGEYLRNNDSNSFFAKIGDCLLVTGPTGTNVNDIGLALID